jgi:chloramphenicol 3-O-phosphotransferase
MFRGLALLGPTRVGKTSVARHLQENFLVLRTHPKSIMGEMITPLLLRSGVPIDEVKDYIFTDRINDPLPLRPDLTTRRLLQAVGGGFIDDIGDPYLAHGFTVPEAGFPPVVIESIRRRREADALSERGFVTVLISRPGYEATGVHSTEEDFAGYPADVVIENDGTIQRLMEKASDLAFRYGLTRREKTRFVLTVNGRPRSGKDELTRFLLEAAQACGFETLFASSIDPVKEMLLDSGIDTSAKTPKDRKLLADVKAALDAHSGLSTMMLVRRSQRFFQGMSTRTQEPHLFVTHIREPDNIRRLQQLPSHVTGPCSFPTVWVRRPGTDESTQSCASDRTSLDDMDYDFLVENSGTLDDLRVMARQLLCFMVGGRASGLLTPTLDASTSRKGTMPDG